VASAKVPTTADIHGGIVAVMARVRGPDPIDRVHIGTTAFTNALVERRGLAPAAAIRVGAPVSRIDSSSVTSFFLRNFFAILPP
jgi:N-methylhydantoinase A/oxoprolinase/acetone carboxylase beta subunit